jgi:hypothetical protein
MTPTQNAREYFDLADGIIGEEGRIHCRCVFAAIAMAGGLDKTDLNLEELSALVAKKGGLKNVGITLNMLERAGIIPELWVAAGGERFCQSPHGKPGSEKRQPN